MYDVITCATQIVLALFIQFHSKDILEFSGVFISIFAILPQNFLFRCYVRHVRMAHIRSS